MQDLSLIRKVVAAIGGLLLLFIVLSGSWYTIDEGDLGVVLRNGAFNSVAAPGLHFKVPLIDSVVSFSVRTQKATFDKVNAYSRDIQAADLTITVNYRIDPARAAQIYSSLGAGFVESLLNTTVLDRTKVVFGQFNAVAIISERGILVQRITDSIRKAVEPRGIIIDGVQIENIDFSDAYESSIEARMQAEVEVTKFQQNLQREKVQAEILRTQAQAQADAKIAAAKAEAESIRLKGEAEASAIKAKGDALRENPGLVPLVQAEKWDGRLPTTMLPNGTLPMLSLQP